MSTTTFLRLAAVRARTGYGRSTIYVRMADGLFPAAIRLSTQSVAWISTEIEAVMAAMIRGATDDELRALVSEMHAARGYVPDEARQADFRARVARRRETMRRRAAAGGVG